MMNILILSFDTIKNVKFIPDYHLSVKNNNLYPKIKVHERNHSKVYTKT